MKDNTVNKKIYYDNRKDRIYAYRYVSEYVPGMKRAVVHKEHLGPVDEDLGFTMSSDFTYHHTIVSASDLGNVLIMHHVACDLGLPDVLEEFFEEDARWVMALIMAQCIHNVPVNESMSVLSGTCVLDLLGLNSPRDGRIPIRCELDIDRMKRMDNMLASKYGRLNLVALNFSKAIDSKSRFHAEHIAHGKSSENNVLISVTEDGMPVSIAILHGSLRNTRMIVDAIRHIFLHYSPRTLVLDSAFVDSGHLYDFLETGADIVTYTNILPDSVTPLIRRLESSYDSRISVDGVVFESVHERIGVLKVGSKVEYVSESDPIFNRCEYLLNASLMRNVNRSKNKRDAFRSRLSEVRRELNGKVSDDPMEDLHAVALEVSPYLNCRVRGDGTMVVTAKRDEVANVLSRAGVSMVLTTSMGWNEAIGFSDYINNLMSDLGPSMDFLNKSESYRFGRMLRKFSAMILARVRVVLKSSGIDLEPREALNIASKYRLITIGGDRITTDTDTSTRIILDAFGIE